MTDLPRPEQRFECYCFKGELTELEAERDKAFHLFEQGVKAGQQAMIDAKWGPSKTRACCGEEDCCISMDGTCSLDRSGRVKLPSVEEINEQLEDWLGDKHPLIAHDLHDWLQEQK